MEAAGTPRGGGRGPKPIRPPPPRILEHAAHGSREKRVRKGHVGILGRDIRAIALGILTAATAALAGLEVRADEAYPSLEYRVKAAFLFNFAKFVEWPQNAFSSPTSPIL